MVLSNKQVKKFQNIYRKYYGKEISKQDAYEQGIKLVRLLSVIYKPMTEDELKKIEERRERTLKLWAWKLTEEYLQTKN